MASLRTPTRTRLLWVTMAALPRSTGALIAPRRWESSLTKPDGPPVPETTADTRSEPPQYDARIDKATSTFTPVPRNVQDGSEEGVPLPAALVSDTPMELQARTVRIYKPTKPASQSGDWHGQYHWRMDWDVLSKGHRWENPLMGWESSADMMQGTHMNFITKEDAIAFAEKHGYEYFVQEPSTRRSRPKAYANNFLYSSKKLKYIRTK